MKGWCRTSVPWLLALLLGLLVVDAVWPEPRVESCRRVVNATCAPGGSLPLSR